MADQKISELTELTAGSLSSGDFVAVVDSSGSETKKVATTSLGSLYNFASRPDAVTWVGSNTAPDGTIITAGDLAWRASSGATDISDMSGWKPFGEYAPVMAFGSVLEAIQSGYPLDWGSEDYEIATAIDETITHRIDWISNGATLTCTMASPAAAMIKLTVHPHRHSIKGLLTFDGDGKVRRGLHLISPSANLGTYPDGYPDLEMTGYAAKNMRLTVTTDSAEGGLVEGGWNFVRIIKPKIHNITMAAGAGLSGSYGAFGFSVVRIGSSSTVTPHNVVIEDADINGVTSDDNDVYVDQDGLRILLSYDEGGTHGTQYTYTVRGGIFKNCRNRSIKGQANLGKVTEATFIRDAGVGGTLDKGVSAEVNEQIGSLSVSDCEHWYDGKVPGYLYGSRTRTEAYSQPSTTISNIRGLIVGSAVPEAFAYYTIESGAPGLHEVNISNVNVKGEIERFLLQQGSAVSPNDLNIFNFANIIAEIGSKFFEGIDGGKLRANFVNVHNSGSAVPLIVDGASSADRTYSMVNVTGFSDSDVYYSPASGEYPIAQQINALVPSGSGDAAVFRPVSFTLAQNESFTLPRSSYNPTASSCIIMSVSRGVTNSQAFLLAGADGVELVSSASSDWSAGTTSDPGSGNFRIWADVGTGIVVKNTTATTRTFTAWLLG